MSNGKWVFTNWNAFVSSSFCIQESNDKYFLAAYDDANKMWVRISNTEKDVQYLQRLMRDMQDTMSNRAFANITYYEDMLWGESE